MLTLGAIYLISLVVCLGLIMMPSAGGVEILKRSLYGRGQARSNLWEFGAICEQGQALKSCTGKCSFFDQTTCGEPSFAGHGVPIRPEMTGREQSPIAKKQPFLVHNT